MHYCRCGYPIAVSPFVDFALGVHLRDGKGGKHTPPLVACPRCGEHLDVRDLLASPPPILIQNHLWTSWTARAGETDEERAG